MTTSGSSGRKGLFVYDAAGWRAIAAMFFRTERLVEAFGVHPFDLYATTEGIWGVECERHEGIHLFEDMALFENVDKEGRPVPEGEPGAKLLVTNLYNLVQPIIRLEVSEILTLDPEPCARGRSKAAATTFSVSRAIRAARWRCIPSSSGSCAR